MSKPAEIRPIVSAAYAMATDRIMKVPDAMLQLADPVTLPIDV